MLSTTTTPGESTSSIVVNNNSNDYRRRETRNEDVNDMTTKKKGATTIPNGTQSEFIVIWQNLTYKVDSRPWYTRTKERFFGLTNNCNQQQQQQQQIDPEDGRCSSGASNSSGSRQAASSSQRVILNQICGSIKSREVTAFLGPSGAGKSSLLHCLFQNRTTGTSGNILVDNGRRNKLKVCFIPQSDYLNEWLTVREDLIFVSKLKLAKIDTLLFNDDNESSDSTTNQSRNDDVVISKRNNTYVKQSGNECNTSLIDHEANALRIAELLGLDNCLNVRIKNISGGQKKRLSIARELMSKPDILVLDEPTTGLDSLTCYKTVSLLRDLAHLAPNPMAVVVTIHQPQREVFNLFDKTYFLSNTGRVIYEDNPNNAVETITGIAEIPLPQSKYNPASFLIEIGSKGIKEKSCIDKLALHQSSKFYEKFDTTYLRGLMNKKPFYHHGNQNWKFCTFDQRDSIYSNQIQSKTPSASNSISSNFCGVELNGEGGVDNKVMVKNNANNLSTTPTTNNNVTEHYFISYQLSNCLTSHSTNIIQSFRHIFILTHRSWLSLIRNPSFTKSRLAFHTILPLMMLMVFGTHMGEPNTCPKIDAQLDLQDLSKSLNEGSIAQNVEDVRLGLENLSFFFILMYGFGINIISVTASFYPLTMRMFKKETTNGLYSPAPYFFGQMLAELPLEMIYPSISIALTYHLSGQLPSFLCWRMVAVSYIVFLVSYCIHSLGLLCGSIFVNNVSAAVLAGQVALVPSVLLSGFLVRSSRMPNWVNRLSQITSFFRLGLNGIIASRYGFNVCECDEDSMPAEGESIKFSGMTPHVKHVLEYLYPKNETIGSTDLDITKVFEKLSEQFVKAQTFALDIKSCDDVKPFMLHAFQVEEMDLFICIAVLLLNIFVFKLITFTIMKSFPYRIT